MKYPRKENMAPHHYQSSHANQSRRGAQQSETIQQSHQDVSQPFVSADMAKSMSYDSGYDTIIDHTSMTPASPISDAYAGSAWNYDLEQPATEYQQPVMQYEDQSGSQLDPFIQFLPPSQAYALSPDLSQYSECSPYDYAYPDLQQATDQYGPASVDQAAYSPHGSAYEIAFSPQELADDAQTELPSPHPAGGSMPVPNQRFPCLNPGCLRSFNRQADLQRHYDHVHPEPGAVGGGFFCDYFRCRRQNSPFRRKDHCRDHLREYHKEDLLKRGGQETAEWFQERNINKEFWRCSRCLIRNKVRRCNYTCPTCKTDCEPTRVAHRNSLNS